jgi:hypothetical protein
MQVLELAAHNVGGIKDIKFDMAGHHLWIVGGSNAVGKTSAIRALLMAICGRSGCDYPEPALRIGESSGWIKVKLSGDLSVHDMNHINVELMFERRRDGSVKETFRVTDSTGDEAGSPRKLLQDLYSTRAFDPLEFDRMPKKDRRKILMKLVGLDVEAFQAEHNRLFDERAAVNVDGKKLAAKFDAMPHYPDAPDDPVSVNDLMDELEAAQKHNTMVVAANQSALDAEKDVQKAAKKLADARKALEDAEAEVARAQSHLEETKQATAKAGDIKDVTDLSNRIKEAGTTNEMVLANRRREADEIELQKLRDKSKGLTDALAKLAEDQDEKMKTAKWPVDGLGIDDEGVLYEGKPYEILNKANRICVSASIAMALNPTLRLMVCEDGSDLDMESLAKLEALLKENDYQMVLELVTRTDADNQMCSVVIHDGEAVAV